MPADPDRAVHLRTGDRRRLPARGARARAATSSCPARSSTCWPCWCPRPATWSPASSAWTGSGATARRATAARWTPTSSGCARRSSVNPADPDPPPHRPGDRLPLQTVGVRPAPHAPMPSPTGRRRGVRADPYGLRSRRDSSVPEGSEPRPDRRLLAPTGAVADSAVARQDRSGECVGTRRHPEGAQRCPSRPGRADTPRDAGPCAPRAPPHGPGPMAAHRRRRRPRHPGPVRRRAGRGRPRPRVPVGDVARSTSSDPSSSV